MKKRKSKKSKRKNIVVRTLETFGDINKAALGVIVPGLGAGKGMGALIK